MRIVGKSWAMWNWLFMWIFFISNVSNDLQVIYNLWDDLVDWVSFQNQEKRFHKWLTTSRRVWRTRTPGQLLNGKSPCLDSGSLKNPKKKKSETRLETCVDGSANCELTAGKSPDICKHQWKVLRVCKHPPDVTRETNGKSCVPHCQLVVVLFEFHIEPYSLNDFDRLNT